jgi:arginyl-tRNA--protein-N-Asp/Glu arginylyltransferase
MDTLPKPQQDNEKYSLWKNYTDQIINTQNNINQGNSKYLIANSSILRKE